MAQEVILVRDGKKVAKLNLEEIEAISGSTFA
jgi:ferredoxin-fold anticodon binding domain-containing protein